MTDRAEQTPVNLAQLRDAIASGQAVVCYARCEPCQFQSHYDPPEWHSWAGPEDVQHARDTGQRDPSDEKCACDCAETGGLVSEPRAEQTEAWADIPDDHEYPSTPWAEATVEVVTEQPGRHTVHPDGQVWVDPPRAEQTQPSGYTPPAVGAPTWSHAYGATISERGDRLWIEWPNGRGMSWVAPKVIEGWVEQVNELRADRDAARGALRKSVDDQIQINVQRGEARAERDRLRAAVAKVRRGEPLTEAELALAEVAW